MPQKEYSWILGAGLGFALGGPLGAILGGLLGHQVGRMMNKEGSSFSAFPGMGQRQPDAQQGDLIISFLVLSAAITKADQQVRASEVRAVKAFLIRSFGPQHAADLMRLFKQLLEQPLDIPGVCAQIRRQADIHFHRLLIQVLFEIAASDNELVKAESELIARIASDIGMADVQFRAIASQYELKAPDRDFELLEISPAATNDEIKSRYRELVKQIHPDKVGHLGKEFHDLAERKFKEVGGAYERIRKVRGF